MDLLYVGIIFDSKWDLLFYTESILVHKANNSSRTLSVKKEDTICNNKTCKTKQKNETFREWNNGIIYYMKILVDVNE